MVASQYRIINGKRYEYLVSAVTKAEKDDWLSHLKAQGDDGKAVVAHQRPEFIKKHGDRPYWHIYFKAGKKTRAVKKKMH